MTKKPREHRVPIMMSEQELTAIDDWRFANRIATRSEAIRRLCFLALTAEKSFALLSDKLTEISKEYPDRTAIPKEALADISKIYNNITMVLYEKSHSSKIDSIDDLSLSLLFK